METITGTLIIVPAGNKEKNYKFHTWIKNIKTINEIINLRNNKKIVKELGTKINKEVKDSDLGSRDTVLGIRKKGTLSKLQVRNKNERTRNQEYKLKS